MKKTKIGKGYWQSGYGRGFKKTPIVWLINGMAYAKDTKANLFQTDLEGYAMLNVDNTYGTFYEVGLISEHQPFVKPEKQTT